MLAYIKLNTAKGNINIHLTSYFESYGDNFDIVNNLPVASVHFDIVRSEANIEFAKNLSKDKIVSLE